MNIPSRIIKYTIIALAVIQALWLLTNLGPEGSWLSSIFGLASLAGIVIALITSLILFVALFRKEPKIVLPGYYLLFAIAEFALPILYFYYLYSHIHC